MERYFDPSGIQGVVRAPASKSMTQRAIAAGLLAEGRTIVHNPSYCDDSLASMSIAIGLGARIDPQPDKIIIDGSAILKETKLNCGEAGLAIRMFSPIAALYPSEIIMSGAASLKKRPMSMIEEALVQLGAKCSTTGGFLPITIQGPIKGGKIRIDGSLSSQLLTGLLMALPLATGDSEITVTNLRSRPYIDMTLSILEKFGVNIQNHDYKIFSIKGNQKFRPCEYEVEGDWSGASFLIVAGALSGKLTIQGLLKDSLQSDAGILKAVELAGAKIKMNGTEVEVSSNGLGAFDFDATHAPDLFPPLVTLASYCKGTSTIKGVSRLIHKESNRAEALRSEFGKMNISIGIDDDTMSVTGGQPTGAHVESHEDHRIAMAIAVAALKASGRVYLKDSQCVSKSYPGFYKDMRSLGALIYE